MIFVFKEAATDVRYFARCKFSRSLVYCKNFTLIWQVVFKLGYIFYQERYNTSFEFEWTQIKVASDNNFRWIWKQAIIKLLLAYSFRKVFFIGQTSKHVHFRWVSNRKGGRNKRGSWQISAKIINEEGAINGEFGKNLQT